jgi:hypothetical protein
MISDRITSLGGELIHDGGRYRYSYYISESGYTFIQFYPICCGGPGYTFSWGTPASISLLKPHTCSSVKK